jgi:transposase InsO family protein
MKRSGHPEIGKRRITRLMREENILKAKPRRRIRTTDSRHEYPRYPNLIKDRTATRPNEIWVADITYVRLRTEFVFLAVIMDQFTRRIVGWELSRTIDDRLTRSALKRAFDAYGTPEIHHSDQGGQYASGEYTTMLTDAKVKISMAKVGEPRENGFAERVIRTIKEECIDLTEFEDFDDAYGQIGTFIEKVYNDERIHSALGYRTPKEFEAMWITAHPPCESGGQPVEPVQIT